MTRTLLDHMPDPELLGHPLDMSRPELAVLMRRYSSASAQPSLVRQSNALIVSSSDSDGHSVKTELENEGWSVTQCLGPDRCDECPLLRGRPCELRRSADVAFVYVDPGRMWGGTGMIPRLRCAVEAESPAVIVLEGRSDDPAMGRRRATIGALRSADLIVETANGVVTKEEV